MRVSNGYGPHCKLFPGMRGVPRAARHYREGLGQAYFAYQDAAGELGARLDRWKFEQFVRPTDTVVDFGCGGGGLLAGLPAARKIGIEVNEPAREAARRRGIEVVRESAELDDEIADVVISNHALEHTLAPFDELCGLNRKLKPGGRLVVWLPLDDWRAHRQISDDPDHHLYTWTPLLLRNLLVEAGFDVHDCRVVRHAWPPFTAALARLPKRAFDLGAFAWAIARKRRQLMAVCTRL
jgi:SAM-dependent methyltransferase